MAIAFDAASNGGNASTTSLTVSHTCSGSDRLLLVAVCTFDTEFGGAPQTPTATYNGVSMTQMGTIVFNTDQRATFFRLVAPATGTNDIVVSLGGDADEIDMAAASFTGVDQTTPVGTAVTTNNDPSGGTSISQDVSSESGDLVADMWAGFNPTTLTVGAGQTQRAINAGGGSLDTVAISTEAGAGTVTMSWTTANTERVGHIAVNINAAGAGGGPSSTPTFVAAGTAAGGAAGVTPGMPSGAATGDILILVIEGEGEDANADNPPTGGAWTAIGAGSIASSTDGAVDRTRCSAYWAPYDAGINLSVPDAGDHTMAQVYAFRGVDLTSPFDGTGSGSNATNTASQSAATGITTSDINRLVCLAFGHGDDGLGAMTPANTSLSSVAIAGSGSTTSGSDATVGLHYGTRATAGTGGTFTWTTSASEELAWIAFALKPPPVGTITLNHIGPTGTLFAPTLIPAISLNHIGPTASLFSHQLNGFVNLNHIGPTSQVFAGNVIGLITLGHIGPTASLFSPTLTGIESISLNHIGPTGTLFSPQLNGFVNLNHIGPTASLFSHQLNGQISLNHIGPTGQLFAGSLSGAENLTLNHIGPTGVVYALVLNGFINLAHIGPTAQLFSHQLNGQIALAHIGPVGLPGTPAVGSGGEEGRGPWMRISGAAGRTRRGLHFTVYEIPDNILLGHIGPVAQLHEFVIPIFVGRGPSMRIVGSGGRTNRRLTLHGSYFLPNQISPSHLGPVAQLFPPNLQGQGINLGHINSTTILNAPALIDFTAADVGLYAPALSMAKGRPMVIGSGFIGGMGFVTPFELGSPPSPIVLFIIGPVGTLHAPVLQGSGITLSHIGPTSLVNDPHLSFSSAITLGHISGTQLFSPVIAEVIFMDHLGPLATLNGPELDYAVDPDPDPPSTRRGPSPRRAANQGFRFPPPYRG